LQLTAIKIPDIRQIKHGAAPEGWTGFGTDNGRAYAQRNDARWRGAARKPSGRPG
jgi:hypothetical protein